MVDSKPWQQTLGEEVEEGLAGDLRVLSCEYVTAPANDWICICGIIERTCEAALPASYMGSLLPKSRSAGTFRADSSASLMTGILTNFARATCHLRIISSIAQSGMTGEL